MDVLIVRHRVAPEGVECPIDHLVVGPNGAYAVGDERLPRAAVREQLAWMRETLDNRGLPAFPTIACTDLAYALAAANADQRFCAATVRRAGAALEPVPPFVATVATERDTAQAPALTSRVAASA